MFLGEIVTNPDQTGQPAWLTSVLNIGQGYMSLKQMQTMQSVNEARLRAGLPPISSEDMAVGAKVAVDSAQLNKILMLAGGGIALIALILLLKKR